VTPDVSEMMDYDDLDDLDDVEFSEEQEAALLVALLRWRGTDLRHEPA
jgi:hypothetical protein